MKPLVAVIADLCLDLVFTGDVTPQYGQVEQFVDDYRIELGGSATIFSSQFTKLGGVIRMYGAVGNDFLGGYLLDRLDKLGISTQFILSSDHHKTAIGLGLARGDDRAMLTYAGSMTAINAAEINQSGILQTATHLHIASYFLLEQLQPFWAEVLPALKQRGMTISLDTNWAPREDWEAVHPILPCIDVLIPNEEEALRISGQARVDEAGRWLAQFGGLVVIKRGEQGAAVFDGTSVQHYGVPEALSKDLTIADTTGAGDNFDAGFVYAWLRKAPLAECVGLALRCGTGSLSAIGGIAGQLVMR